MSIISNFPGGGGAGAVPKVDKIEVSGSYRHDYYSGEMFEVYEGFTVMASYKFEGADFGNPTDVTDKVEFIPEGSIDPGPITDGVQNVLVSFTDGTGKTVTHKLPVTVTHSLKSITAVHDDTGVTYEYGGALNTSKVTVTALYSDNETVNVTAQATIVDATATFGSVGPKTYTVKYRDDSVPAGQYKETTFQITVYRKTISEPSWKADLTYSAAEQSVNDVSKWNNWNGASEATISAASVATGAVSSTNVGTFDVVFTCTANYRFGNNAGTDVLTCTKSWTMNPKGIAEPTLSWTSNAYNGAGQHPVFTYDSTAVEISGDTENKIDVDDYSVTFTLKNTTNYKWSTTNDTASKTKTWSITQVTITVTLNPTTLKVTASALSPAATINYSPNVYDGSAPTVTPTSLSGLTSINATKTQFTVTGNGSTAFGETTFTLAFTNTKNCKIAANPTIKVSAEYWSWGQQPTETAGSTDGVGDATWWAGLKAWAATATADERAACVTKTKRVTLSSAVAGFNQAIMVCIGADQDGVGTLTFQTKYCSPTQAKFSSKDALWSTSDAKTSCENFANNCSASGAIKQVTKLTSTVCNNNKNNAADGETLCKGWLPSECEMGIGGTYSSSNKEWTKGVTGRAYDYYTGADRRIKHYADANGNDSGSTGWYWERSRYYGTSGSGNVCGVNSNGNANSNNYDSTNGRLAPAFVIG